MSRYLDRKPTAAAYRHRPDFAAVGGPSTMLSIPVPDDTEILAEAFFVAVVNDRIAVLDYMIDRGFPVDYLEWEMPFVSFAAGNQRLRVVECLVRRGADLDIRGRHPDVSAREMARERFKNMPTDTTARQILELCGAGDPEQLIAELEARPAPEPDAAQTLREALDLAGDDAARREQTDIRPDNLLIGIFRATPTLSMDAMHLATVDMELLRSEIGARVLPPHERVQRGKLPLDSAAQAAMQTAITIVKRRKQDIVITAHLLRALCDADHPFVADLLDHCGSSVGKLRGQLDSILS